MEDICHLIRLAMRFEHDERTSRINKGSGFDNYRNQAFYLFLGRTFSISRPGIS